MCTKLIWQPKWFSVKSWDRLSYTIMCNATIMPKFDRTQTIKQDVATRMVWKQARKYNRCEIGAYGKHRCVWEAVFPFSHCWSLSQNPANSKLKGHLNMHEVRYMTRPNMDQIQIYSTRKKKGGNALIRSTRIKAYCSAASWEWER